MAIKTVSSAEDLTHNEFFDVIELINNYKNLPKTYDNKEVPVDTALNTIGILLDAYRRASEAAGWDLERQDEEIGAYIDSRVDCECGRTHKIGEDHGTGKIWDESYAKAYDLGKSGR